MELHVSEDVHAIWADDKFSRRQEAENIVGYLESVAGRATQREDHRGHVLAIDAEYGEGKTFFLKRLKRHLSINHPVAYVDACPTTYRMNP